MDIAPLSSTISSQTKTITTNEISTMKSRLQSVSGTSNTNEILTVLAIPVKVKHQFSIAGGGVLTPDSDNFHRFHRLRRIALWCCIISFILDISLGLTAFINCIRSKSFVGFSYSIDTLMDSLCTSFVSWHLMTTSVDDIRRRDRLACCVIGVDFFN